MAYQPEALRERLSAGAHYHLSTDGGIVAAVGQAQGEGAIGVVLKNPDGTLLHDISVRIGWITDHHIAEYRALIAGLRLARGHGVDNLRVSIDSAVVEGQINQRSSVKPLYLDLLTEALRLKEEFQHIEVTRVLGKENREAHARADAALAAIRRKRR
jgi:ribonuclease HI